MPQGSQVYVFGTGMMLCELSVCIDNYNRDLLRQILASLGKGQAEAAAYRKYLTWATTKELESCTTNQELLLEGAKASTGCGCLHCQLFEQALLVADYWATLWKRAGPCYWETGLRDLHLGTDWQHSENMPLKTLLIHFPFYAIFFAAIYRFYRLSSYLSLNGT